VIDLDRERLDRVLPSPPSSPDWDDVVRRARVSRGRRRRGLVALAAAALVVAAVSASALGTARNLFQGPRVNEKISFTSVRGGSFDTYVMSASGRGQRRLVRNAFAVVWSPDGRRVAFMRGPRSRPEAGDLYVMNADGTGLRRLTDDDASQEAPLAWSPDGRKIAFQKSRVRREAGKPANEFDLWVVDADGGGARNLTGDGVSYGGAWSPDGRRILVSTSQPSGRFDAGVMNADGSGRRTLTRNAHLIAWSPDGRRILSLRLSSRGGDVRGPQTRIPYVYVMNADGSGERRLTRMASVNYSLPAWSPDGRRIAFVSGRDGNFEVYVINVDGTGKRNLTRHPAHDSAPAWSPDGRKIAFTTKRDGNFEVYVMNADGSGLENLTKDPEPDRGPIWLPGRIEGS
jgi:Tol biopolymer transport system component